MPRPPKNPQPWGAMSPQERNIRKAIQKFAEYQLKYNDDFYESRTLTVAISGSKYKFSINDIKPKKYVHDRAAQAERLGITVYILYRLLSTAAGAHPWTRRRLAEVTGTAERLWERGGDPAERKAAIDAWWAMVKADGYK